MMNDKIRMTNFGFWVLFVVSCLLLVVGQTGCGQTTASTATTTTTSTSSTSTTTASTTSTTLSGNATITGQVAASSGDLSGAGIQAAEIHKPGFRTLANTTVASATMKLYKIQSNGTEIDTGKITTSDANGVYTFTDVTPLSAGAYKVVAEKAIGSSTLQESSLVVVSSATSETANVAPESTIVTKMFDNGIKNQFTNIIVDQSTIKELKNLAVDDTEKLVDQSKLVLPSMLTSNAVQVVTASDGITDNRGNAEKAFKKLEYQNLAYEATVEADINKAIKVLNDIEINGSGENNLIADQALRPIAQALLNGSLETVSQVISSADDSIIKTGGTHTPISASLVISSFEARLNDIQTAYEKLTAGTTDEILTSPQFLTFKETERQAGITATSELTVPQQIALKDFIEAGFLAGGETLDDITFATKLGYLGSGGAVATNETFISDVNLYYGNYGGWKLNGSVNIFIPRDSLLTVSNIKLISSDAVTQVASLAAEGNNRFTLSSAAGVSLTAGVTAEYIVKATFSDNSTRTAPVTVEVIDIPEPVIQKIDGTPLENLNSPVLYYQISTVSDFKPILKWSTAEVASVSLPTGYSWAYFMEITRYGTANGATTLEVDDGTATSVYASGSDMANLFTRSSFLFPVEITTEVSGAKVAYKVYLQRVLLNSSGKYNGIAAGAFRFLRKI